MIITIQQKTNADNRAEWWRRYTWAEKKRTTDDEDQQILGWEHLAILTVSPLAIKTEAEIIQLIASRNALGDNEATEVEEAPDNVDRDTEEPGQDG